MRHFELYTRKCEAPYQTSGRYGARASDAIRLIGSPVLPWMVIAKEKYHVGGTFVED